MKHKIIFFFLSLFLYGQALSDTVEEFTVKSAFIIKMTLFIEWPENSNFSEEGSSFKICMDHHQSHFNILKEWSKTATIKNKSIYVQTIDDNPSSLSDCNIFYISDNHNLDTYLRIAEDNNILTISDIAGNAQRGVVINFFRIDDNLRFEINLDAAKNHGLKINPRLLKLATIVSSQGIVE